MGNIVVFRPGACAAGSAFEAMATIYEYLQDRHGHSVSVLLDPEDTFESDELDVVKVPEKVSQPLVPRTPIYPRRFAYRRHLDPFIENADLLVTYDPTTKPPGALAIRRALKLDTPVFVDASATVNGDFELLRTIKRPIERRLLRRVDRIIVTVPKTVERFRDRRIYDTEIAPKFEVLGHPVDTKKFSPASEAQEREATTILTISRLTPEKGLPYIVEAIAPLIRGREDRSWVVVGDGPMEGHLRRTVERHGIDGQVDLVGSVPHDSIPEYHAEADLYVTHAVSNSHWEEFFGVANLEAMACGVPTVVSDSGGIPYVIRESGVAEIVTQRDVSLLREAVKGLLEDPDHRRELGERGRRYVEEHYDMEVIGDRYAELVGSTIENDG